MLFVKADGPTLPIRAPRRRSQPDTGYSGSSLPSLSLSAGSSAGGHASSALPYRLPPPASQASPRSGLGTSPSTVRQRPRAAQPQHTQQATIPAQSTQQVTQSSNLNPFAPPPGVTPMFSTPAQETTTFTQSNGQVMAENNVCIPPPRTVPRPLGALSPVSDIMYSVEEIPVLMGGIGVVFPRWNRTRPASSMVFHCLLLWLHRYQTETMAFAVQLLMKMCLKLTMLLRILSLTVEAR